MRPAARSLATLICGLWLVAFPAGAAADGWHSEQPLTPGGSVPVPIGQVNDIEFWAPNRGVLITGKGLWAYDGTDWHQLSTVCGGTDVAWAGPLDFWTISDQRPGQEQTDGENLSAISLCHFVDGAIVASYAEPVGVQTSYRRMNAAACLGPNDCWFAGERLSGDEGEPNSGAFHLHWNGEGLTAVPSLAKTEPELGDPEREVFDFASLEGSLYESVRFEDNKVAGENAENPFPLHRVSSEEGFSIQTIFTTSPFSYNGGRPSTLDGFLLSSDGHAIWGIAGPGHAKDDVPSAPVVAFRYSEGTLSQLAFKDPANLFGPPAITTAVAAVPGAEAAWVGYTKNFEGGPAAPARLALLHADGTVDSESVLPGASEGLARKGPVSALACPAPDQCWMAAGSGWLFHLGGSLPRDEAPAMHQLITFRPPDGGTPILPPDTLPSDDSGSEPGSEAAEEPVLKPRRKPRPRRPLVAKVKQQMVSATVLELSFTLSAKARVQLLAKRRGAVVAKTRLATFGKGRHQLRLRLDPKRWPNKFDLHAKPVKRR